MKFLSWFFMILGCLIILNGLTMGTESSIHQIYAQTLNLTGFAMFYCGLVLPKISLIADRLKTKEEKEAEETKRYNDTHYYKKEDERPTAGILAEKENK